MIFSRGLFERDLEFGQHGEGEIKFASFFSRALTPGMGSEAGFQQCGSRFGELHGSMDFCRGTMLHPRRDGFEFIVAHPRRG
jgi:hypothetical protein